MALDPDTSGARLLAEELATVPRCTPAQLAAIPGRVKGSALRDWGAHVIRHWGPGAPDQVRATLGLTADELPDHPPKKAWYPVSLQMTLAHAIVDTFLDGDMMRFEGVFDDTTGTGEKVMRWVARKLGPVAVLKRSGWYHGHVCDVGTCDAVVGKQHATLTFSDGDLFGNASWRLLQIFGIRGMFKALGREHCEVWGEDRGPRDFVLQMRWQG